MANNKDLRFAQFAKEILAECEGAIDELQNAARKSGDQRLEKSGKVAAEQMRKAASEYIGRYFREQYYPKTEK